MRALADVMKLARQTQRIQEWWDRRLTPMQREVSDRVSEELFNRMLFGSPDSPKLEEEGPAMRALADVMKLDRQAQRIQELEAENEALLKYASELVDKCVALKHEATEWKIRAAESRRLGV